MITCTACGAELPDGILFCEQCGAKLPAPMPAGQAQPAQVVQPVQFAPASVNSPVPVMSAVAGVTCNACGHVSPAGSRFCEECGTPLAGGQAVRQPVQPNVMPPAPPIQPMGLPKFILPNGATIAFAPNASRVWLIGREDAVNGIHPDVDLTPHDTEQTVSRKHAQISLMNGQALLTNLTTTNWTTLNGTRLQPNQPAPLKPGDKIEFASCVVTFELG